MSVKKSNKYTPSYRQKYIINFVKSNLYMPNAQEIADKFKVNIRTIERDIFKIREKITLNPEDLLNEIPIQLKEALKQELAEMSNEDLNIKDRQAARRGMKDTCAMIVKFFQEIGKIQKPTQEVHITQDIRELFLEWRKLSLSVESGLNSTRINTNKTFLQEQAKAKE